MLSEYVSSLSHVRKLTWEEEMALWKRYKEDEDIEARQEIIEHYQLLVFKEAIKYPLQETVVLDLIQEGMVGLMEAAEKFNPDNGVAFSLYALHRVRGRMIDFLRQNQQEVLVDMQDEIQAQPYLQSATGDTAFESADFDSLNHAVSSAFPGFPGGSRMFFGMYTIRKRRQPKQRMLWMSVPLMYINWRRKVSVACVECCPD